MQTFDGRLTDDQLDYLQEHGISKNKIRKIEHYLKEHKEGLTDYVDLVGDDLIPGSLFLHNLKYYGYLLDLDPEKTFSAKDNMFGAKVMCSIIHKIGKYFLSTKQVFEDRNELLAFSNMKKQLEDDGIFDVYPDQDRLVYEKDQGIVLPDSPVIWTLNHRFKDDVLASVLSIPRQFSLFFGSIPQFYNTFDGVLAYHIGTLVLNRKSKASRTASQDKLKYVIDNLGLDVLIAPEGVWNKNPHKLLEHFWPGVYRIAKETNSKVVPIVHYIKDPTQTTPKRFNPIHTVIDDPIDITYMPEAEALEYYRDKLASWYFIMIEKYGRSSREELLCGHDNMATAYEEVMRGIMATVDRYDTEFEKTFTYHPKGITAPQDVFEPIALIEPTKENVLHQMYAQNLVGQRKKEDYQGRF